MEGSNSRNIKRQLPQVPKKKTSSDKKARSTGTLHVDQSTPAKTRSSSSVLAPADSNDTLSPPGTRVFMGYTSTPYEPPKGEDSSVLVAVRVRPFSEREVRYEAKQVIHMSGNDLTITRDSTVHRFQYDYCFWSFDDIQGPMANQERVYREIGQPLLDKAFQGYNTCLFAYGQTGSGKSYCIMGEGPSSLGIIPQFANELYERIEGTTDADTSYKVEVSYYEIYKERIHDLLASVKQKSRINLRVREHPVMGPYVEDLSTYVASSFKDVEQWLALGNRFRATAATGMNDKSSRSHSVFTLLLTQTKVIEGQEHVKVSRINLIDLAGSERSSLALTSGERLKEGASINRSLHTLGKVISLLSEKSTGKRRKVYIPYRDSTLTWLLKESLGGNSKTAMIATISPADLHYEESLSTLRYAQTARTIVNVARINEDPNSRLIRELRQEIDWLRSQLGIHSNDPSEVLNIIKSHEEVKQLKEKLSGYEKLMKEMTTSWEERLRVTEERKQEEAEQLKRAGVSFKVDNRLPNLVNLNEDPQLSEMLLYLLKEGVTTVGRHTDCDIQLSGALVTKQHCLIHNTNDTVTMVPSTDSESQTFINGTCINKDTILHHGDRVIFAGEHFFRFNHPLEAHAHRKGSGQSNGFQFAHEEYIKAQTERLEAETLRERQKMMRELEAVKVAAEETMNLQRTSYENKLRDLEGTLSDKSSEVSQRKQQNIEAEERITELEKINQMLEEETIAQRHIIEMERMKTQKEYEEIASEGSRLMEELEIEKRKLEGDIDLLQKSKANREKEASDMSISIGFIQGSEILRLATMLQEANVISKNLGKTFNFSRDETFDNEEVIIRVRVTNTSSNKYTLWDIDKFETRLEQIREIYQHNGSRTSLDIQADDEWVELTGDSDPFYDPDDIWKVDSLFSPTSSDERRQSFMSMLTTPTSGRATPKKTSTTDVMSSLPKRLQHSFYNFSPSYSPSNSSSTVSPNKKSCDLLLQLVHGKIATLMHYKHSPTVNILSTVMSNITNVQCIANEIKDTPLSIDLVSKSIDLHTSLQLLLHSILSIEPLLKRGEGPLLSDYTPYSCYTVLIDTVVQQTTLYASKTIQDILKGEESSDHHGNLMSSIEEVTSTLGQVVMATIIEGQLNNEDSALIIPEINEELLLLVYNGYQSWTSAFLNGVYHSLLSTVQEMTTPTHTDLLQYIIQLVNHLIDLQVLFWKPHPLTSEAPPLSTITHILSLTAQLHSLSSTQGELPINDINKITETLGIKLLTFLKDYNYDETTPTVQATLRNVAMATRSLKQGTIPSSLSLMYDDDSSDEQ